MIMLICFKWCVYKAINFIHLQSFKQLKLLTFLKQLWDDDMNFKTMFFVKR